MIHGLNNRVFVLSVLADGKPHFSREFVRSGDEDLLLDYRKRISELRREGYMIQSIKIGKRPGYQLLNPNLQRSLL